MTSSVDFYFYVYLRVLASRKDMQGTVLLRAGGAGKLGLLSAETILSHAFGCTGFPFCTS